MRFPQPGQKDALGESCVPQPEQNSREAADWGSSLRSSTLMAFTSKETT